MYLELAKLKSFPVAEKTTSPTSASQRMESSWAFLNSPFRRLEKVTCLAARLSILLIAIRSLFPTIAPQFFLRRSPTTAATMDRSRGEGARDKMNRTCLSQENGAEAGSENPSGRSQSKAGSSKLTGVDLRAVRVGSGEAAAGSIFYLFLFAQRTCEHAAGYTT
jgi:hypothetical protein